MLKTVVAFLASSVAFAASMSASCTYGTYDGGGATDAASGGKSLGAFDVTANQERMLQFDDGTLTIQSGKGSFSANAKVEVFALPDRPLGAFKVPAYDVRIEPASALTGVLVVGFIGGDNRSGEGRLAIARDDANGKPQPLPLGGLQGGGSGGPAGGGTNLWGVAQAAGVYSLVRLPQATRTITTDGHRAGCETCCGGSNRDVHPGTCQCNGGQDNGCIFETCKQPVTDFCGGINPTRGAPCPAGKDGQCEAGQVCCYRSDQDPTCAPSSSDCTGKGGLAASCSTTSCTNGICCIKAGVATCQPDCGGGAPRCDSPGPNGGQCSVKDCMSAGCRGDIMKCGSSAIGACGN